MLMRNSRVVLKGLVTLSGLVSVPCFVQPTWAAHGSAAL